MAGGATADGLTYLADLMSNGDLVVPSYYIALCLDEEPGFGSSGEDLIEPDSPAYARARIINDGGNWNVTEATLSNVFEVSFPAADIDWGKINYWAICDEPTEGRVFFCGQFENPIYVLATGVVTMPPGAIWLSMSGTQWASEEI